MKLISCKKCAVILDHDKLKFAESMYDEQDCIDGRVAEYNQDAKTFQLYVPCPVCNAPVFKEGTA